MATQTSGTLSPEEEQKKALEALSISRYNKVLGQLTQQEKSDLFRSYKAERQQANTFANDPAPQGRQMGGVYAPPTWSANLSHAVKSGMGQYQNAKLNQSEKRGRETAANLAATQADQAEQRRREDREREENRWQETLTMLRSR